MLTSSMVAPEMAPPLGSVTVPCREVVEVCATAQLVSKSNEAIRRRTKYLDVFIMDLQGTRFRGCAANLITPHRGVPTLHKMNEPLHWRRLSPSRTLYRNGRFRLVCQ